MASPPTPSLAGRRILITGAPKRFLGDGSLIETTSPREGIDALEHPIARRAHVERTTPQPGPQPEVAR